MNAQAPKLEDAENDLKQLMADVTRAMEKAQQAVARIASKPAAATTEPEVHLALERVLFAALGKCELTSASPSYAAGKKTSSEVAFVTKPDIFGGPPLAQ